MRLPNIVLSAPRAGFGAQAYDDGSGPCISTGAGIHGIDGMLIHRIGWQALGLSSPALDGVPIGLTFATVDLQTRTMVVDSVP